MDIHGQPDKKPELLGRLSKGRAGCSLPLPPFLLAGMETQWLEPKQTSWSMRTEPCLEDRGVAGNQIPKDVRKRGNGGQTRPYRVVKKNQTQSSARFCYYYHGY